MAKRRTRSKLKNRASGGSVRVKGHRRSPRGPSVDKNGKRKPRPKVKGYRRRPPSK